MDPLATASVGVSEPLPTSMSSHQAVRDAFQALTRARTALWPTRPRGERKDGNPHTCLKALRGLEKTIETLQNAGLHRAYWELTGYAHWEQRQYKQAAQAFEKIPDGYLAGLMHLASGNMSMALQQFMQAQQTHGAPEQRSNPWGSVLLGLVTNQLSLMPSVLQVRQHLEADMALLLQAGQTNMLNALSQYTELMGQVNPEGYKLMGRAVFNGGMPQLAGQWLLLAQRQQPHDAEVYYHLGQWYTATRQFDQARRALNQCLMMAKVYPPAEKLLATLPAVSHG